MSTVAAPAVGPLTLVRAAAFAHSESRIVVLGLAVVALHVVDDNYVQTQRGTSAGDHLASGLVPLAVLTVVAVLYPRLRAGLRASLAMTLGAIGITFGVPGARTTFCTAAPRADDYSGLLAIVPIRRTGGVAPLHAARPHPRRQQRTASETPPRDGDRIGAGDDRTRSARRNDVTIIVSSFIGQFIDRRPLDARTKCRASLLPALVTRHCKAAARGPAHPELQYWRARTCRT